MTAKPSGLLSDYAAKAPDKFAKNLESSTSAEVFEILAKLPNKGAAAVLARLQPYKTAGSLSETTPLLLDWLADGEVEDSKAILIRLPQSSRSALVGKLPSGGNRLALQRFLNYPKHSLGRYVSNSVICVALDTPTGEVLDLIKSHASGTTVLAINGSGSYAGILDARQVLEGNYDAPIKNYLDKISPLRSESTLFDAMEAKEWQAHTILPVVDYDNQVLGVISQSSLIARLGKAPEKSRRLDSFLTIFQLYMKVLVSMIDAVFVARK